MIETQRAKRRHLLMTKELLTGMPGIGTSSQYPDPKPFVKFFSPYTGWTWFALEGEVCDDGDVMFYGLVCGHEKELGYFTLSELETSSVVLGRTRISIPTVERDCSWTPVQMSKIWQGGIYPREI